MSPAPPPIPSERVPSDAQQESLDYPHGTKALWIRAGIFLVGVLLIVLILLISFGFEVGVCCSLSLPIGVGIVVMFVTARFSAIHREQQLMIWRHGQPVVAQIVASDIKYYVGLRPVRFQTSYRVQAQYEVNGRELVAWSEVMPAQHRNLTRGSEVAIRVSPTNEREWVIDLDANLLAH